MKRKGFCVFLSLAFSLVLLSGCQRAAEDANRAAPCPTPEPVDAAAIEKALLQMERDWLAATTSRDVATVSRIEADDIVMTYPDGSTGTKADEIKTVEDGAITVDSWELVEPKVNVIDADAAVVTGRTVIKNGKLKGPKGNMLNISGEYRFTDVFARRNGQWQAVASQLAPVAPGAKPSPSPSASPAMKTSPAAVASPAMGASPTTRPAPPVKASPVTKPTP